MARVSASPMPHRRVPASPLVAPSAPIPVPLITPRYQKKTRTKNAMTITPIAAESPESSTSVGTPSVPSQTAERQASDSKSCDSGSSTSSPVSRHQTGGGETSSVAAAPHTYLRHRSEDALHIKHGTEQYSERVRFHTYELFRHGKHQVQSRSVGYSSDGDLVMYKDAYSLIVSDSDTEAATKGVAIDQPVCLNPAARRPLSESEAVLPPSKIKAPRFRKYPGIKCPKNRKVRNRLLNDHFANDIARKIYDACKDNESVDDMLQDEDALRPVFPELTRDVSSIVLHRDEDAQRESLKKLGVTLPSTPPLGPAPGILQTLDPNSGEARFLGLNSKLRDELKNAISSEFLTQQIIDLESYFTKFIQAHHEDPTSPTQPMSFQFRDGYGRLVCHGVAAYYNLVSTSVTSDDGSRQTVVSLPKATKRNATDSPTVELPLQSLLQTILKRQGRSPVLCGAPSPIMPTFSLDDPLLVYSEKHVDAAIQQSRASVISATERKKLRKSMKQLAEQIERAEEPNEGKKRCPNERPSKRNAQKQES